MGFHRASLSCRLSLSNKKDLKSRKNCKPQEQQTEKTRVQALTAMTCLTQRNEKGSAQHRRSSTRPPAPQKAKTVIGHLFAMQKHRTSDIVFSLGSLIWKVFLKASDMVLVHFWDTVLKCFQNMAMVFLWFYCVFSVFL